MKLVVNSPREIWPTSSLLMVGRKLFRSASFIGLGWNVSFSKT